MKTKTKTTTTGEGKMPTLTTLPPLTLDKSSTTLGTVVQCDYAKKQKPQDPAKLEKQKQKEQAKLEKQKQKEQAKLEKQKAREEKKRLEELKKRYELKICTRHTGKMQDMVSLSTSPLLNSTCQKRAKNKKSICYYCFSQRQLKRYKNQEKALAHNTALLNNTIIPAEYLPITNNLFFRLEAFGDLSSTIQVINYFNLCKKNPLTHFALWTKNPWYIQNAINQGEQKPANLVIIYSSFALNYCQDRLREFYPFIDKVFTVYSPDYIKAHNTCINCGARHCFTCLKCYYKENGITTINEQLK